MWYGIASGAAPQEWGGSGAVAVLCWQGIAAVLLGNAHPDAAGPEMLSLRAAWCTGADEDC